MSKQNFIIFFTSLILTTIVLFGALHTSVFALNLQPKLPKTEVENKFQPQGLPAQIINEILPIILSVAGFFAVVIIILSGIQFTTSQGNPEGAAAARNRLTYAIIGFIIIVLAFAILQIINSAFLKSNVV